MQNDAQTTKRPAAFAALAGSALSPEMQRCLSNISERDGTIVRHPGGFWYPGNDTMRRSYSTPTVEALVKRSKLEYCEWKQSHSRQFPIKARLTPNDQALRPARGNEKDTNEK